MTPRFWYINGLDPFRDELSAELRKVGRVQRWGHRAAVSLRDDPSEVQTVLGGKLLIADGAFDGLATLTNGDLFGLHAPGEPVGKLEALDDLHIASLPRQTFERVLDAQQRLSANVGVVRRRKLSVPVQPMLFSLPRQRVATVLLHLIESVGSMLEGQGKLDFLPNTRTLARLSGLADETVSAIVKEFEHQGLLELRRGSLIVPSMDDLQVLALETP